MEVEFVLIISFDLGILRDCKFRFAIEILEDPIRKFCRFSVVEPRIEESRTIIVSESITVLNSQYYSRRSLESAYIIPLLYQSRIFQPRHFRLKFSFRKKKGRRKSYSRKTRNVAVVNR
jgi:hypothetical protein